MEKLFAIIDLFRKGNQVANPEVWKDATNSGLLYGALIMSLLSALKIFFKIDIGMDLDTANSIGAGFGCLVAFVVNNISSKRAGILPPKDSEHPIAVPEQPTSTDAVDPNPTAVPEVLHGPEEAKGLPNAGMPQIDEAALKEALRALRRDRGRAPD